MVKFYETETIGKDTEYQRKQVAIQQEEVQVDQESDWHRNV